MCIGEFGGGWGYMHTIAKHCQPRASKGSVLIECNAVVTLYTKYRQGKGKGKGNCNCNGHVA